jgi:hypothetical protein
MGVLTLLIFIKPRSKINSYYSCKIDLSSIGLLEIKTLTVQALEENTH